MIIRTGWGGYGMFQYVFRETADPEFKKEYQNLQRPKSIKATWAEHGQAIDEKGVVWSYRKTKKGIVWKLEKTLYTIDAFKQHVLSCDGFYSYLYWIEQDEETRNRIFNKTYNLQEND